MMLLQKRSSKDTKSLDEDCRSKLESKEKWIHEDRHKSMVIRESWYQFSVRIKNGKSRKTGSAGH